MKTEIELITPDKAKEYLSTSVGNRAIRSRDVEKFIRDLRSGNFLLTHQGIAFDTDGHLRDGHHRLTAIALSGVSADMMVTSGMPKEAFSVIDNGSKRTFEDALVFEEDSKFDDYPYYRNKASVAMIRKIVSIGYNSALILSNAEIKKLLMAFGEQVEIIYHASVTKKAEPAAVRAASLSALLCGESREDIESFFEIFSSGNITGAEGKNISAAFNWKKQIMEAKVKKTAFSNAKLYSGTQNAIWSFINLENTKLIRATSKSTRYPVDKLIEAILKTK